METPKSSLVLGIIIVILLVVIISLLSYMTYIMSKFNSLFDMEFFTSTRIPDHVTPAY